MGVWAAAPKGDTAGQGLMLTCGPDPKGLTMASAARRSRPTNPAGEVTFARKPLRFARGAAASAERRVGWQK